MTVSTEPSDRGPNRKVYTRTAAGLVALREWLSGGPRMEQQRIEHLAQLFFLDQAGEPGQTRAFLEELREVFGRRLSALRAIEAYYGGDEAGGMPPAPDPDAVHPYLTLRYGIRRLAATVEWCEESLELLSAIEPDAESGENGEEAR